MANEPRSYKITVWASGETLELSWESGSELKGWTRPSDGYRAIETSGDPIFEDSEGFEAAWEARSLVCDSETCGADPNGWNVYRFTSDTDPSSQEFLGSATTREEAHRLANRLRGDQIQEGLTGKVYSA